MSIIATLPTGQDNGIDKKTLMAIHGYHSERPFRQELQDERKSVGAICTKGDKYFRPASTEEYKRWREPRLKMAFTIIKDIFVQDKHFPELHQIQGQTTLDEIINSIESSEK